MTYLQILRLLERYAWNQPDVHSVVREFTDLNRETAQYAAVVIQDRDGERDLISDQDWITYTWHIGYVDRLWEEKMTTSSGERTEKLGSENIYTNRDDIYSQGIRVINNIIAGLRKDYDLDITTPDRINTFNQRFTAECAGVYMVIAVTVPVSDCEDSGVESMYDSLNQRFTTNGTYHFVPEGKPWNEADIVIDVHPQESLVTNFTENGTYDLEGEWKDARIGVFVHPSTSLSETYTENGTYNIDGEFNGGQVTVAVPQKEEEEIDIQINNNGTELWRPEEGKVWSQVRTEVDVHPSQRLTRTYTTNGTKDLTGEWKDGTININVHPSTSLSETYTSNGTYSIDGEFNGGEVTVAVSSQKPEESLVETITSNGSYSYSPQQGYVYDGVSLSVDVHPSTSLSETYTSNGTYSIDGEFNGGEVTVAVSGGGQKPEESLVETITSNGSYSYSPQQGYVYDGVSLSVDVHPSTSLSETYTSNGTYNISGEFNGGQVTVAVSGGGQKPEESLIVNITSNGSYNYAPQAGYVFSSADVTVSVPDYYTETIEYLFGNCGSDSKIFYYDGSDGGDYTNIISALPSGWTSENLEGADGVMYYMSSSGQVIEPNNVHLFDKDIVSNTYSGGVGEILFDGPVKYTFNLDHYGVFSNNTDLISVSLPSSLEVLGPYSFYSCTNLTSVSIPSSVDVLDSYSFCFCSNLSSVSFESPSNIIDIGDGVFRGCTNLTSVSIPSSVKVIGYQAFNNSGLTSVTIPSSVEIIGGGSFEDCSALTSVSFESPYSLNRLGTGAFRDSGLTSITIPSTVEIIGIQCFLNCSALTSVSFESPSSLRVIKFGAFQDCNISSITIPSTVETIEEGAFYSCRLRSITIPSSVTSISNGIVGHNFILDYITVDVDNQVYDSRNGCNAIIETSSNVLIQGCRNTVIPDGIVSIYDDAFNGIYIRSINIPSSVTNIGKYAFSSTGLSSVTIPSSVTNIGQYAFTYTSALREVIVNCTIPPSLGGSAFNYTSSSLQIKVPAASLQDYLTAPGWSNYADKIVAQ